ncbi:MAG: hypothetical protein R3F14_01065 [Polyangiaceae bacterium]
MKPRWILAAALALVTLGGAAHAQPKKAELEAAKKEAVALADKGVEAFRADKYQDAIDAFKKADAKFHVPKFLLYVARAQVKLGKLIDAKATYKSIVDEKLAAYAPAEFFTAQTEAKKELVELENRIPTVRIEVNGAPADQAPTVTLDGVTLTSADLGRPLARDPGAHVIVVTAPGRPQITRNVNLREGGSESVILEMGVTAPPVPTGSDTAPAPTVTADPTTSATSTAPDTPKSGGLPTVTIAAWGVGAAGLVAGAVMGGLAFGKFNEYNESPTRDALDQGRLFSLVADIGFGTAVVGAAVGTVYWLVAKPSASSPEKSGAHRSDRSARPIGPLTDILLAPSVGTAGGGAVVIGRF